MCTDRVCSCITSHQKLGHHFLNRTAQFQRTHLAKRKSTTKMRLKILEKGDTSAVCIGSSLGMRRWGSSCTTSRRKPATCHFLTLVVYS